MDREELAVLGFGLAGVLGGYIAGELTVRLANELSNNYGFLREGMKIITENPNLTRVAIAAPFALFATTIGCTYSSELARKKS